MSDFLARLALRATDATANTAVRPRPLGRFESPAEPRAAAVFDAGDDQPAPWPAPPRHLDDAPATTPPVRPARPSAAPPAAGLVAPPAVSPRTLPIAAAVAPSHRAPSTATPSDTAAPSPVAGPRPAAISPPPAAAHYLRDLLPRAARVAPPGERPPAADAAAGQPWPRPAADPVAPFTALRPTRDAGDAAVAPPRPLPGHVVARPPATPGQLAAPPAVAPGLSPALLAQLRAALHPGPDERPLPSAQPPPPAPVVHVHIGRVELRAAPPPRPSAPARPGPTLPTVDDYLRRRNGERS